MKKTPISTRQWWLTGFLFIICHLSFCPARAQTFTEQLQQSKAGEGKVTVIQSKDIDQLVNTPTTAPTPPTPAKPQQTTKPTEKPDKTSLDLKDLDDLGDDTVVPDSIDFRKKIMKGGTKVNGFRVQVFAGGNGRADRLKAQRTGEEIKTLFPNEPIYVHFYSPRWICRMGNYRTYEEAHEILTKVKQFGYPSATIVKGKITVYYP
jgi:hypothetical protein